MIRCCVLCTVLAVFANAVAESFSLKEGETKVIDFGPDGVGGYPSVSFAAAENARVRLSYATHPAGLGEKGDFWHETRANYMGNEVWLPILPANTDRFDVFEQNRHRYACFSDASFVIILAILEENSV